VELASPPRPTTTPSVTRPSASWPSSIRTFGTAARQTIPCSIWASLYWSLDRCCWSSAASGCPGRQGRCLLGRDLFPVNRVRVGTPHRVALAMSGGGTALSGRSRNTYRPCRLRRRRPRCPRPGRRHHQGQCRRLRRHRPHRRRISSIRSSSDRPAT